MGTQRKPPASDSPSGRAREGGCTSERTAVVKHANLPDSPAQAVLDADGQPAGHEDRTQLHFALPAQETEGIPVELDDLDELDIDVDEAGEMPLPPVSAEALPEEVDLGELAAGASQVSSPLPWDAPGPAEGLDDLRTDVLPTLQDDAAPPDISDLPTGIRPMPRPPSAPADISDLPTGIRPMPRPPAAAVDINDLPTGIRPMPRPASAPADISDLPTGIRPMPRPPAAAADINDLPTGIRPAPQPPGPTAGDRKSRPGK